MASLGLLPVGAAVVGAAYGRGRLTRRALAAAGGVYVIWGALLAEAT